METNAARKIEEPAGGLGLEPETVLPSQFFERFRIDASLQPEKRLMLAVLEDAVGAYQKYVHTSNRRARRLFVEAEEWFEARERDWPYGFENICEALNLEAEYLRRGLRGWRQSQVADPETSSTVLRFPFRRVNGRRHSITGRPVGLRHSA